MNYNKKSVKQLKAILQKHFNKFIRERDQENGMFHCISCGQIKPVSQMHAGHYYPAGNYQSIRFHLKNVNGECVHCNYYSGDHHIHYKKNLIKKWGPTCARSIGGIGRS